MKLKLERKNISALIAAILIFLFLDPYFMWNFHHTTKLYAFLEVFLLFVFLPNADIKTKGKQGLFFLFALLLLISTIHDNLNFFGTVGVLCLLFVPFAKEEFAKKSFDYFLTIYAVVVGISAIVWILSLIGIVHPIGHISPLNIYKPYNYNVYPLLVRPDKNFGLIRLERFMGPFDEPGVIGTISALVLTVGKFNLKNKRLLIVFIASILTMSFFYYVIVAVYYLIHTFTVSKDKKTGIVVIAIMSVLVVKTFNDESLNDTIWSRFMFEEDSGFIAGDNRMSYESQVLFDQVVGTSAFYFGITKNSDYFQATLSSASLLNTIVLYGLIFVVFYVVFFAAYGWKYKKSSITYILYLFVFIGSIYQRPFIFQPEFLFLFSLMAMSCGDLFDNENDVNTKKIVNNV